MDHKAKCGPKRPLVYKEEMFLKESELWWTSESITGVDEHLK